MPYTQSLWKELEAGHHQTCKYPVVRRTFDYNNSTMGYMYMPALKNLLSWQLCHVTNNFSTRYFIKSKYPAILLSES